MPKAIVPATEIAAQCTPNGLSCVNDVRMSAARKFHASYVRIGIQLACGDFRARAAAGDPLQQFDLTHPSNSSWWGTAGLNGARNARAYRFQLQKRGPNPNKDTWVNTSYPGFGSALYTSTTKPPTAPASPARGELPGTTYRYFLVTAVVATPFEGGTLKEMLDSAYANGITPVVDVLANGTCIGTTQGKDPVNTPAQWTVQMGDLIQYIDLNTPFLHTPRAIDFEIGNEPDNFGSDLSNRRGGFAGWYTDGAGFASRDGTFHFDDVFGAAASALDGAIQGFTNHGFGNYRIITAGMIGATTTTRAGFCTGQQSRRQNLTYQNGPAGQPKPVTLNYCAQLRLGTPPLSGGPTPGGTGAPPSGPAPTDAARIFQRLQLVSNGIQLHCDEDNPRNG